MIWLSFVVYIISLFMVHHYETDAPYHEQEPYPTHLYQELGRELGDPIISWIDMLVNVVLTPADIIQVLAYGRISYRLLWLLNLVYFFAVFRLSAQGLVTNGILIAMGLSILIALSFQFSHYEIQIPLHESFVITQKGSGYYCWVMSFGEFYQFNLSSCIRQQNSLTAQFVSFSLANLANIFYPPPIFTIINLCLL